MRLKVNFNLVEFSDRPKFSTNQRPKSHYKLLRQDQIQFEESTTGLYGTICQQSHCNYLYQSPLDFQAIIGPLKFHVRSDQVASLLYASPVSREQALRVKSIVAESIHRNSHQLLVF